ncbi:hypothetical protein NDU88_011089 [Pleurodeles waltl]|uniref:Uncharacterized protein n=1 Tax=Pleurodeles waltl TaxID=8319 RepID=A0AAV7S045_PLEWA|nr:hypothetical protein NDU88_011089 [Pleurodeles waltl]
MVRSHDPPASRVHNPLGSPGSLRVVTEPIQGGDNITLVFTTREELIRVRWYLVSRAWDFTKEIYNGTEATLKRPPWGYELVVTSNASVWEDALNVDGHWCHSLSLDASQCPEHDVMYHCGFENKFESVQAAIPVSVIQPHERFCPSEYHDGVWNATRASDEAMIPCPDGKMGSLCRSCSLDGVWGHVRNHCMDKGLLESLQLAEWLHSGIGNPHKEIPSLIKKLRIHTMPGDLTSPRDLNTAMAALETITRRATDTRVWLNRSTIDVSTRNCNSTH